MPSQGQVLEVVILHALKEVACQSRYARMPSPSPDCFALKHPLGPGASFFARLDAFHPRDPSANHGSKAPLGHHESKFARSFHAKAVLVPVIKVFLANPSMWPSAMFCETLRCTESPCSTPSECFSQRCHTYATKPLASSPGVRMLGAVVSGMWQRLLACWAFAGCNSQASAVSPESCFQAVSALLFPATLQPSDHPLSFRH
eukprot:2242248-Rhodomonas_salina.2